MTNAKSVEVCAQCVVKVPKPQWQPQAPVKELQQWDHYASHWQRFEVKFLILPPGLFEKVICALVRKLYLKQSDDKDPVEEQLFRNVSVPKIANRTEFYMNTNMDSIENRTCPCGWTKGRMKEALLEMESDDERSAKLKNGVTAEEQFDIVSATRWFKLYTDQVKDCTKAVAMLFGRVTMICVKGGLITDAEQHVMGAIKKDIEKDLQDLSFNEASRKLELKRFETYKDMLEFLPVQRSRINYADEQCPSCLLLKASSTSQSAHQPIGSSLHTHIIQHTTYQCTTQLCMDNMPMYLHMY